MVFSPTDPAPMYREDPAYVVNTPTGRIDFTTRDILRDIRTAPTERK